MTETFDQTSALRTLAVGLRTLDIPRETLLAKFPERPTTPGEFLAMSSWIAAHGQPATEGMYRKDGQIYKVVRAVHGSGHLYAKQLDVATRTFEVAKGMVATLRQSDRMSTADAAEFGHLYGFCVRCGAPLTDEVSIARGMGPVCSTKI